MQARSNQPQHRLLHSVYKQCTSVSVSLLPRVHPPLPTPLPTPLHCRMSTEHEDPFIDVYSPGQSCSRSAKGPQSLNQVLNTHQLLLTGFMHPGCILLPTLLPAISGHKWSCSVLLQHQLSLPGYCRSETTQIWKLCPECIENITALCTSVH